MSTEDVRASLAAVASPTHTHARDGPQAPLLLFPLPPSDAVIAERVARIGVTVSRAYARRAALTYAAAMIVAGVAAWTFDADEIRRELATTGYIARLRAVGAALCMIGVAACGLVVCASTMPSVMRCARGAASRSRAFGGAQRMARYQPLERAATAAANQADAVVAEEAATVAETDTDNDAAAIPDAVPPSASNIASRTAMFILSGVLVCTALAVTAMLFNATPESVAATCGAALCALALIAYVAGARRYERQRATRAAANAYLVNRNAAGGISPDVVALDVSSFTRMDMTPVQRGDDSKTVTRTPTAEEMQTEMDAIDSALREHDQKQDAHVDERFSIQ